MSSLLAITTRLPLSSSPAYLTSDLSSLLVAVVVVVALLTTVYAITRLLLSLALIIYHQDIARCQPRSHSIPSTFHPQMHKSFLHIGLHETRTRSDLSYYTLLYSFWSTYPYSSLATPFLPCLAAFSCFVSRRSSLLRWTRAVLFFSYGVDIFRCNVVYCRAT